MNDSLLRKVGTSVMRRIMMIVVVFSLFLSGCTAGTFKASDSFDERELTQFDNWVLPPLFVASDITVVGLGDSLTEGIGDEDKQSGYFGRLTKAIANWQGVKDVKIDNLAKKGRRSDQLLTQLEDPKIQASLKKADIILFTIGGNDLMKIFKRDLFNLKTQPFMNELDDYTVRIDELYARIRSLNKDAIIVTGGLYNPLSNIMDETDDFETILDSWNDVLEARTTFDDKSCFVPVRDLFHSNGNMVYHSDFFHPNAKGYEEMTNRYLESIETCNLYELSDGQWDM